MQNLSLAYSYEVIFHSFFFINLIKDIDDTSNYMSVYIATGNDNMTITILYSRKINIGKTKTSLEREIERLTLCKQSFIIIIKINKVVSKGKSLFYAFCLITISISVSE